MRILLTRVSETQILLFLGRQLLLHPLRKYPGPFLAKFTDGYIGYHAMLKRLHLATYDGLTKYGKLLDLKTIAWTGSNLHKLMISRSCRSSGAQPPRVQHGDGFPW